MNRAMLSHGKLLAAGLAAALSASCGDATDTAVTQLNLDRPVDMAFACYGGMRVTQGRTTASPDDPITTTAQPATSCETRSPQVSPDTGTTLPIPPGQEDLNGVSVGVPNWYGFILQSASGTVAVARWASKPADTFSGGVLDVTVLDADPLTPGKNAISIGEDPVAIATDKSGCYEVTANAGTCDVSVLDINTAVAAAEGSPTSRIRVDRLPVKNRAGTTPILAKPAAMVAEPNTTVVGNVCTRTDTDGLAASGIVYIAYPGCNLVAAVDISDGVAGRVVGGIQFQAGVPTILDSAALDGLSCPAECSDSTGTVQPGLPGTRPVALDLRFDLRFDRVAGARRLAIGAANSSSLTIVELDASSFPQSVSQVALEDNTGTPSTMGITSVSMSPVIGMGNTGSGGISDDQSSFGGKGQYVYAVATDTTVHVADVTDPANEKECDTQIDTRFARSINSVPDLQCIPIGNPETPRRSGAKGPGIQLPDDSVPTSVTIFGGRPTQLTSDGAKVAVTPTTLVGYFAVISTSTGKSYVVNVDDDNGPDGFDSTDPVATSPALVMAHQLRDSFTTRGALAAEATPCTANDPTAGALTGGPRSTGGPTRNVPTSTLPAEFASELPIPQQQACLGADATTVSELQLNATLPLRDEVYPDLRSSVTEGWSLTWEGPLSISTSGSTVATIDGPQVRVGQMVVDTNGMRLTDSARPFCEMGVETFDIVQFRGCNPANNNADCPAGYSCFVHPRSKVSGIGSCMLADQAERFSDACFDFLATNRRYTVAGAHAGQLELKARKHELYATPLDGCSDEDPAHPETSCNAIAQYVAGKNPGADPFIPKDETAPTKSHTEWSCRADAQRKPLNADPAKSKRCVQTCGFHSTDETLKTAGDPSYDGVDRDADCANGTICVGATYSATGDSASRGVCMESILPPPACVTGPQMFDVRAGEAFTVIGTTSGYVHPLVEAADGTCAAPTVVPNEAVHRLQIGRIPLNPPPCDPLANSITGELPAGGFGPNPCSTIVSHIDLRRNYAAGTVENKTCVLDATTPTIATPREAPAVKFSNRAMTIHLVDPFYPGDQSCPDDRLGPFNRVSMVPPGATPTALGYQVTFDQRAGFTPLTLGVPAVYPVKVLRGPSESIWVLDDGDYLPTTLGLSATRGQVYRVESVSVTTVGLLQ